MNLKIAILGTKGVPGRHGVEVVVDSLLPHLSALGHEITVYAYSSYSEDQKEYHGARVKTVVGKGGKNLQMITHMWNASLDTRRESYDLIHIHSTDPCLLAWLPKSKYGVVASSHGQAYIREKWGAAAKTASKIAERFFIYLPNVVTSVSKPLAELYRSKYKKPVHYIPNGVKRRRAPNVKILQKWSLTAGRFLFCSAGRIERTKGLHTLLEAYGKLKTEFPLVIAGGGSGSDLTYHDSLRNSAPEGVRFLGFLTGDELFSLYAHAGIFVFPSEYEAMSMALLEGLSFGTPTVYSDIPENKAVADGLGYAFKVSDSESLAGVIKQVLANYEEAINIGGKAKEVVREKHNWANIAKMYNDLYIQMKQLKETTKR
uniref:Glycosyltransferase family 4 protein n=1 Tax=Candidatus Desulfatibia profunda TaxID=2841695 RepID=A0A8J6TL19_9BACT|nr:glycosyltransferase family 4 protein [Candidatus Desulfatibia profunda]